MTRIDLTNERRTVFSYPYFEKKKITADKLLLNFKSDTIAVFWNRFNAHTIMTVAHLQIYRSINRIFFPVLMIFSNKKKIHKPYSARMIRTSSVCVSRIVRFCFPYVEVNCRNPMNSDDVIMPFSRLNRLYSLVATDILQWCEFQHVISSSGL